MLYELLFLENYFVKNMKIKDNKKILYIVLSKMEEIIKKELTCFKIEEHVLSPEIDNSAKYLKENNF